MSTILQTSFSRRNALRMGGMGTLSAAAMGLLGGVHVAQAADSMAAGDVSILNVALGLEYEAIAAYQIGAESKLLSPGTLKVAVGFQSQHKEHRDALIATIQKLGGKPASAKRQKDYGKDLNVETLKSEADVLNLAKKLEIGAANAYIGVIPSFQDKMLAQISARLAADETMHWTVLAQATGEMLPAKALTFGA